MNKNKRTLKIFLDNFNTASFTGTQFNASYYVDLKTIIRDDEDFDKSYNVYVNFRTIAAIQTSNGISSNARIFLLNIDFNKGLNTLSFGGATRPMRNISHILDIKTTNEDIVGDPYAATPVLGIVYTYLELSDPNQMPSVVQNLRNVNTILLQVLTTDTGSVAPFVSSSPANSKYACIITFVEM